MRIHCFFLFTIGLLTAPAGEASPNRFEVAGQLFFRDTAPIYCFLVDEAGFSKPLTGLRKQRFKPTASAASAGRTPFAFSEVPAGRYGIRCFQDLDGNGTLNRGLFGPSEPWGMSFRGERPMGRPRFEEIAFTVDRNIRDLHIEMR